MLYIVAHTHTHMSILWFLQTTHRSQWQKIRLFGRADAYTNSCLSRCVTWKQEPCSISSFIYSNFHQDDVLYYVCYYLMWQGCKDNSLEIQLYCKQQLQCATHHQRTKVHLCLEVKVKHYVEKRPLYTRGSTLGVLWLGIEKDFLIWKSPRFPFAMESKDAHWREVWILATSQRDLLTTQVGRESTMDQQVITGSGLLWKW